METVKNIRVRVYTIAISRKLCTARVIRVIKQFVCIRFFFSTKILPHKPELSKTFLFISLLENCKTWAFNWSRNEMFIGNAVIHVHPSGTVVFDCFLIIVCCQCCTFGNLTNWPNLIWFFFSLCASISIFNDSRRYFIKSISKSASRPDYNRDTRRFYKAVSTKVNADSISKTALSITLSFGSNRKDVISARHIKSNRKSIITNKVFTSVRFVFHVHVSSKYDLIVVNTPNRFEGKPFAYAIAFAEK